MARASSDVSLSVWATALVLFSWSFINCERSFGEEARSKSGSEQLSTSIVQRIPLEKLGSPPLAYLKFCSSEVPALAYVQGKNVFRAFFDGRVEELFRADVLLDARSLRCDASGSVSTVFSYDGSELFVLKNRRIGRYRTGVLGQHPGPSPQGEYLSPNGQVIVAPYKLTHHIGDDLSADIRFVELSGERFAWRGSKVIFFRHLDFTVNSYDLVNDKLVQLAKVGARYKGETYSVTGLQACGTRILMSVARKNLDQDRSEGTVFDVATQAVVGSIKGILASATVSGADHMCTISKTSMSGETEVTRYEFIFDREILPYRIAPNLNLGNEVAIAPKDCLVRGMLYPQANTSQGVEVVILKILSGGRCKSP